MSFVRKKEYVRRAAAFVLISVILPFCFDGFAYADSNPFLDVTAGEIVNDINIGWNLENSLDSHSTSYEQFRPNSLSLETA